MLKLFRKHPTWSLIGLFFLLFVLGMNGAALYTDWLWFGEVGYRGVFGKILSTRLLLFALFGGLSFLVAFVNLRLAARFAPPPAGGVRLPGDDNVFVFDAAGRPRRVPADGRVAEAMDGFRKLLAAGLLVGALVFALVSGMSAAGEWESFLRFTGGARWNERDPLFGRDFGFYAFTLPFLRFVQGWLLVVLLVVGAGVAALYVVQRGIDTVAAAGRVNVAPHVRAHLSALASLALLTVAWGYWLSRFDLLQAGGKLFTGAGYTDVHARLPALNLLVVVTTLAAAAVLVNLWKRSLVLPAAALALWGAVAFGAGVLYPGVIQSTVVRPNEASRERPFIARALSATRRAYGLENVTVRDFPVSPDLNRAAVARGQGTLKNIRLWDYEPLRETYPQQQGFRQYYGFPDVDVDRYQIGNGDYRQVWLAAREIRPEGLDARARTWPNLHLRYTHGYGVVMSPAGEFTGEGLPTFFLKDIPVVSNVPNLALTEPRIYYGQGSSAGTYVVVGTRQREFDFPTDAQGGGGDAENTYAGRGGVRLGPLAKWAFSLRFRDPTLMLSRDLTPESRLLFARQVPTRVRRVAPFLRLDADPYPVISGGRLIWVQDAYTTTDAFPYAEMTDVRDALGEPLRFNYIRNAVKATVDAYDGAVTLYAADAEDPVLRTYRRVFPGLVKPLSAMPAALRAHLRYPEDLFSVQRRILADYHVSDPGVFYARTDSWQVARAARDVEDPSSALNTADDDSTMLPYYLILRLPGETAEEFVLASPFTPRRRENMSALLAARCDGDRYGQLVLYRFPPSRTVYGPEQISKLILGDSRISPQISLWNREGSRVLLGSMLVVPVEKSLLYVQPLYIKAKTQASSSVSMTSEIGNEDGGGIPTLKRVIVGFENRVVMDETLQAALAQLFGGANADDGGPAATRPPNGGPGSGEASGSAASPPDALIDRAATQYRRAEEALRRGDLEAFGREYRALGETVRRLRAEEPERTRARR